MHSEEMSNWEILLPKSALLMTCGIDDPAISSHVGKLELRVVIEEYKRGAGFAVLSSLFRCCRGIPLYKEQRSTISATAETLESNQIRDIGMMIP